MSRGRETYEAVLADPTLLASGESEECEELVYVAEGVAGDDIDTRVSYETGSNPEHWTPQPDRSGIPGTRACAGCTWSAATSRTRARVSACSPAARRSPSSCTRTPARSATTWPKRLVMTFSHIPDCERDVVREAVGASSPFDDLDAAVDTGHRTRSGYSTQVDGDRPGTATDVKNGHALTQLRQDMAGGVLSCAPTM